MRKGNLIRIVRTSSGLFWIGRLTSVSLRGAITFSLRGPRMVTFTELGVMAVVFAGLTVEVESVWGSLESRAMLTTIEALMYGVVSNPTGRRFLQAEGLTIPTFLNFGKDNAGVPASFGDYIYSYFIRPENYTMEHQGPKGVGLVAHQPGVLYLARVRASELMESKSRYEFFRGLDDSDQPLWGAIDKKRPVFEDSNGAGWCLSASYNPEFGRFILATQHSNNASGLLGFFDAPTPWGPWTTIEYFENDAPFGAVRKGSELAWSNNVFFAGFARKWLNSERFVLNFTGGGNGKDNDSFNTVEGRFVRTGEN